ncbi:FadR/GntR family transcriptional regulator [Alteribacillus sp. JSM 102045]|uniref:FadR/GntR family transcriptional regulator n=1 Tax=Alteribacillus sp. JSM 102045 TaxID=1562101 RepID=UPI0035BFAB6B
MLLNVEKISRKKVSALVAEQIENMIEDGTFQPGEKLPSIRELCELLDVGRSAVRDAFLTLNGKGAVYVKQGEGAFICEFDSAKLFNQTALHAATKNIRELFQVRKILETGTAEAAAIHRSEEDIKTIENILAGPLDGWESDYQFHIAMTKATGNKILIQLMEFISATMKQAMKDFHAQIRENEKTVNFIMKQHLLLFEAIKAGNAAQAKQAMITHLNYVEDLLQDGFLEETSALE